MEPTLFVSLGYSKMQPDVLMHEITGTDGRVESVADPPSLHRIGTDIRSSPPSLPMHARQLSSGLNGSTSVLIASHPCVELGESCCSIFSFTYVTQSNFDAVNRASIVVFMYVDEYVVVRDSSLKPVIIILKSIHAYGDFDVELEQGGSAKNNLSLAIWNDMMLFLRKLVPLSVIFSLLLVTHMSLTAHLIFCLPGIIGVVGGKNMLACTTSWGLANLVRRNTLYTTRISLTRIEFIFSLQS